MTDDKTDICKICGAEARFKCAKNFGNQEVKYFECQNCHFLQAEEFDVSKAYKKYANESNFGWRQRNIKMLEIIMLIMKLPLFCGRKRILDFGSGPGDLVKQLRKNGIDAYGYEPFLKAGHEEFLSSDIKNLSKKKASLVSCIEVLEHLWNPFDFLKTADEILQPKGCVLISTGIYNPKKHSCNWRYLNPLAGHVCVFSQKAFDIFIKKNNFHVVVKATNTIYLLRKNSNLFLNSFDFLLKVISSARAGVSSFFESQTEKTENKATPKTPIFIVGCPRSGTTLLRLMLDKHSQIAIPDETGIFYFLYHYPGRQKKQGAKILEELRDESNLARKALGADIIDSALSELKSQRELTVKKVVDSLFLSFAAKHKKNIWGEKTPNHVFFIKDILKIYPGSAVIYIVRDPRAVAASMKRYIPIREKEGRQPDFWMTKNVEKAALMWLECHKAALEFKSRIYFLEYEELVRFPEQTVKSLCQNCLNIPYEPEMLEYYQKAEEKIVIQGAEKIPQWHKAAAKNPELANIDKWQQELSPDEIYKIEFLLKKYMQEARYELRNKNLPYGAGFLALIKGDIYVIKNRIKLRLKFIKDSFLKL